MYYRFRGAAKELTLFALAVAVALFVGLTLALSARALWGLGQVGFSLVLVSCVLVFIRLSRQWSALGFLAFVVFYSLLGYGVSWYVHTSPLW